VTNYRSKQPKPHRRGKPVKTPMTKFCLILGYEGLLIYSVLPTFRKYQFFSKYWWQITGQKSRIHAGEENQ